MATKEKVGKLETPQEVVDNANKLSSRNTSSTTTGGDKNLAAKLDRPTIPQRKRNNELDKTKDSTGNISLFPNLLKMQ